MEKIVETQGPNSTRVVPCTPQQLREVADRLEKEGRSVSQPGEYVLYPLSAKITLMYSPAEKK